MTSREEKELYQEICQKIGDYTNRFFKFEFDPKNPCVRLHEPTYSKDEICEALDSLLTTKVTMGPKVRGFEEQYASQFGYKNAIMVNSGSSANLLAVATLCNPVVPNHLKAGDEVLVPALCWSTTVWPLIQCGLKPVFVDLDLNTLNIDPEAIEKAIGPRTRALKLVHVYGNPCDMHRLKALADKHNLFIIEDACEAMGAYYDDQPVGSWGDIGTFSTYFSHHITTLEGGLCVTQNPQLDEVMRILRAHGWVRDLKDPSSYIKRYPHIDPKFLFVNLGYNFRATEAQGGFGLHQLGKLNGFVERRRQNASFFRERLSPYEKYFHFQSESSKAKHAWFGFPMVIRKGSPFDRGLFTQFLNRSRIETRPLIAGNMAVQPAMDLFEHRKAGPLSNSQLVMENGFTFANHQAVNDAAREYIATTVDEFFRKLKA